MMIMYHFISRFLFLALMELAHADKMFHRPRLSESRPNGAVVDNSSKVLSKETSQLLNELFEDKKPTHNSGSDRRVSNFNSVSSESDCCLNGGTCVLNTFCYCRRGYHGRRCEFRRRERSCGPIAHDTFFTDGCNFCQCFDGVLTCVPSTLNCDNAPNPLSEGPQVFNLRKHRRRHKGKPKLESQSITTTLHPLLVKVLNSGSSATLNAYREPLHFLLVIFLVTEITL